MIEELKKAINENGDFVLIDNWGQSKGYLELHIPNKGGSMSIRQLPMQLGIDAIVAHIEKKRAELEKLKTTCKVQLLL